MLDHDGEYAQMYTNVTLQLVEAEIIFNYVMTFVFATEPIYQFNLCVSKIHNISSVCAHM